MSEFNLSEKIFIANGVEEVIFTDDIREFIKRLKEGKEHVQDFGGGYDVIRIEELYKLAGDELV